MLKIIIRKILIVKQIKGDEYILNIFIQIPPVIKVIKGINHIEKLLCRGLKTDWRKIRAMEE